MRGRTLFIKVEAWNRSTVKSAERFRCVVIKEAAGASVESSASAQVELGISAYVWIFSIALLSLASVR